MVLRTTKPSPNPSLRGRGGLDRNPEIRARLFQRGARSTMGGAERQRVPQRQSAIASWKGPSGRSAAARAPGSPPGLTHLPALVRSAPQPCPRKGSARLRLGRAFFCDPTASLTGAAHVRAAWRSNRACSWTGPEDGRRCPRPLPGGSEGLVDGPGFSKRPGPRQERPQAVQRTVLVIEGLFPAHDAEAVVREVSGALLMERLAEVPERGPAVWGAADERSAAQHVKPRRRVARRVRFGAVGVVV